MKRFVVTIIVSLLLTSVSSLALEVTALAPVRGTPGTLVTVNGGPFTPQTQLFLGEYYVAPLRILDSQVDFTVPYLPPGNYQLSVQDNTMVAAQTYQFEVMAPTPEIIDLSPSNFDVCSDTPDKLLTVTGRNFQNGASLMVDDIVMPSQVTSTTSLEARLQGFERPGIYGVSVRNPDGATSLPHSLWVDNIPEIAYVERGDDFVNYYEVIIHGKNFRYNSTLVVKEPESSTIGQAYRQLSFSPRGSEGGMDTVAPQRNRLIYVDCQTLVYYRYPSNFQNKSLGLQVLNPDGSRTDIQYVNLP